MRILITGASGFVGSLLTAALAEGEHELIAAARDTEHIQRAVELALRRGQTDPPRLAGQLDLASVDVLSGDGLAQALEGVDVAYYLIHSMERGAHVPFPELERIGAQHFAAAARAAGVSRIIYLGGLTGEGESASVHMASRLEVERILLEAVPDSVALRASIVIGAGSRSFRVLVRLVERMPVLTLPAWHRHRTCPIDARDTVRLLIAAAHSSAAAGRSLEIVGPETLSYGELLVRIAELMLVRRPTIGLSVSATPLSARIVAAITGEDPQLMLPLMGSLDRDLLLTGQDGGAAGRGVAQPRPSGGARAGRMGDERAPGGSLSAAGSVWRQ